MSYTYRANELIYVYQRRYTKYILDIYGVNFHRSFTLVEGSFSDISKE